jgi:hypothetical protein
MNVCFCKAAEMTETEATGMQKQQPDAKKQWNAEIARVGFRKRFMLSWQCETG